MFTILLAFKLALPDFGRAINICPRRAHNYFFRSNCQSKLGNYELVSLSVYMSLCLCHIIIIIIYTHDTHDTHVRTHDTHDTHQQALGDLDTCESLGFGDVCTLLLSRGVIHRLMRRTQHALFLFSAALRLIDEQQQQQGAEQGHMDHMTAAAAASSFTGADDNEDAAVSARMANHNNYNDHDNNNNNNSNSHHQRQGDCMRHRLLIYCGLCYIDQQQYLQARKMFIKGLQVLTCVYLYIYVCVDMLLHDAMGAAALLLLLII